METTIKPAREKGVQGGTESRSRVAPLGPAAPAGWRRLLGASEQGARDAAPEVEGEIPAGLNGVLYRNGPGLFERGALRKPHLLDGDGLVQRLEIRDRRAHYRNAFVRTEKFAREEAAGAYLYATWSMRRPGGRLKNLGAGAVMSQAGVTVQPFQGKLYAFDEVSPPWTLDPKTLATLGPGALGDPARRFMIKAHTKLDPVTGEWLLIGVEHGRHMKLHAITHDRSGALRSHQVLNSPRQVYLHDFFVTRRYFIYVLHPMFIALWPLLSGKASLIESLRWQPEAGNVLMLVPRAGGEAKILEAPAAYMWHALNAYDEPGGGVIADFVGYDAPDHFVAPDAALYRIMTGETGRGQEPGMLRRYRIDPARGRVEEEILDRETHEFPMVDPRAALARHASGFFTAGGEPTFNTGLKRVDFANARISRFDFGPEIAVGEPVFAPKPGGRLDQGWLISQCLDGKSERAFFAIFDAEAVAAGPLALLWLRHPLPLSFHGVFATDPA